MSLKSLSTMMDQPILSLSTEGIDQLQHADINNLGHMWNVFNKCKNHLANGKRLEYMSWRLWQFQHRRLFQQHEEEGKEKEKKTQHELQQKQNQKENIVLGQQVQNQEPAPIKQYISTFLSLPIHDVHEVAQPFQKNHSSTSTITTTTFSSSSSSSTSYLQTSQHYQQQHTQHIDLTQTETSILNDNNKPPSISYDNDTQQYHHDSSHCSQITSTTQSIRMITPPLEQQIKRDDGVHSHDDDADDEDDYFLSDEDEDDDFDEDDYFYYPHHNRNNIDVVNYFKKTQPRPTPRRSLLSDLIQKQCMISSSTTYCSSNGSDKSNNSNSSTPNKTFEQDLSQSLRDSIHRESLSDQENSRRQDSTVHRKKNEPPLNGGGWLESFHGW